VAARDPDLLQPADDSPDGRSGEGHDEASVVVEHVLPADGPRALPNRADHDRYAYVLQGEVTARVGRETVTVGPGNVFAVPQHYEHALWNSGAMTARVLVVHVIDGRAFDATAAEAPDGPPSLGRSRG
jgi:quercetin dioxygenase-like cupin family protein